MKVGKPFGNDIGILHRSLQVSQGLKSVQNSMTVLLREWPHEVERTTTPGPLEPRTHRSNDRDFQYPINGCVPFTGFANSRPLRKFVSIDEITDENPLLVSIVIANYNYADYVGHAIRSALSQTYPRVEIIVVDDGSTDRSLYEISSFLPSILFVQVEHQGQIGACIEGFRRSHGDVLIFLDADDVLLPDAAAMLCRPFGVRKDVAKVQGYMSVIDSEGQSLHGRIPKHLPESGDYRALTLKHGLLPLPFTYSSGNAWSRAYLQQVFPLPLAGWLDDYLHDLAPLHGRIESVEEMVVQYRVHGKNSWYGSRWLTPLAMRGYIDKVNRNVDYLVAFMSERGYPTKREEWRKYKRSWRDVLVEATLSRMSNSGRGISFVDFISAPYGRGQAGPLKTVLLSLLFAGIWLLPKESSIELSRWLLRSKGGWQ